MTPPAEPPGRAPPVWLLVAATALGPVALNIFLPAMPQLAGVFGTDTATVGLTLSLYLVAFAVAQLFYGPIADRWGRRPTLLGGLAGFVVAAGLCAVARSIELLIAARVLQAVGGCAAVVVVRAVIRDSYGRERGASVLAFVTMAMAVAPAVSPVIGGALVERIGWRATFVVLIAAGLVLLVAAWRHLPETQRTRAAGGGWRLAGVAYRTVLGSPVFVGFALCLSFTSGAFFAFIAGAPFIVVNLLHGTPSDYGLAFMMVSGGYIIGSFLASRASMRLGVDRMIVLGGAIALTGCGVLLVCLMADRIGLLVLFLSMAVIAIGNGIGQPSSIAAGVAAVPPATAGTASGLIGFGQMAVGGLATFAVHRLDDGTAGPMIGVMAASSLLAALAYLLAALSDRAATRERLAVRSGA